MSKIIYVASCCKFHRFVFMATTLSWYIATHSPIHPTDVSSVSLGVVTHLVQLFALVLSDVTPSSPTVFSPLVQILPVLLKQSVRLRSMIDLLISLSLLFLG
jgi:hypothetical protein